MDDDQERYYKQSTLNKIFAAASIILLLALLGLFKHDYSREWKKYQRDFRELEIEKTRVKYDLAFKSAQQKEEYQTLLKKIEEAKGAQKSRAAEIKKLEHEITNLQAELDIANQQLQFARAQFDSEKYYFEEFSKRKSPKAQTVKQRMDSLGKKIQGYRLVTEDKSNAIKEHQNQVTALTQEGKLAQKDFSALTKQVDILEKKLRTIDPQYMSIANNLADIIRNLPIIDLANPSYKVQQVVLSDLKDNVNFMRVPKVDRCMTCHLGIANPDYKDAPQPFTTHPNLELFLGSNSKHPLEEFGCTTCHGGRGRATDFNSAVHTPSTNQQKEEWEKNYHWKEDPHWETPMLPLPFIQASCFKCHSGEVEVPKAEKLNFGLHLISRAGCYACHTIEAFKDWPKPGPDLRKLASKTSKEWAYLWIADPKSFRHNTWMPSFFGQSNNSDPESLKRSYQEIHAIVHYLFAQSEPFVVDLPPVQGDPVKGKELVASLGCFGCHQMDPEKKDEKRNSEILRREQGPNLIGLGTKTERAWLYNWLKDPNRYHPETRMPNLRLSDQEASDIATYFDSDKREEWLKNPIPKIDESILNTIVQDFLLKSTSIEETKKQLAKMSETEKLYFSGEKLIRQYGCFSCHNIKGFENDKPIGTELTEEGSKDPEKLDFGFVNIPHSRESFFHQKLRDPRIFDMGKLRDHLDKLKMPNYHFSDEEIEAITTALLGFVNEPIADSKPPQTARNIDIAQGRKIIREFNCQGCHILEGEGGAIRPTVIDYLVQYKEKSEAEATAMISSSSPPNLIGEGKKVQTQWLFDFIHHPEPIRPWLSVRMPTYHFSTSDLNDLVKYFNALDDSEFPFTHELENVDPASVSAGGKLFSNDYFGCAQCHIVGDKMPAGSPDSWAPNFALAKRRLRPEWIIEWLKNPQDLLPGTKMPTYFDPQNFDSAGPPDILDGDEHLQIKALRDYILTLGSAPAQPKAEPPPQTEPKVETPKDEKAVSPEETKPSATNDPNAKSPTELTPGGDIGNQLELMDSSVAPKK